MLFASVAAGQANQFGPDMGKAKAASKTIFKYIDIPSLINAVDIPEGALDVGDHIKGEITIRDVWFRYPSRKNEWVFKNLNLTLHPNESVAIVGESGSGKSTLVNLLLRFYDPDQGSICIDGIDIKKFNLRQLRQRMGLVMQEPTLFNYTVKENILYGKDTAKDSEVRAATEIANGLEFIESQELQMAFDDSPQILLDAYERNGAAITIKIGEEKFASNLAGLRTLVLKEKVEGKFQSVKGEIDERGDELRDIKLHAGFDIDCGIKGGKLSGGQKQRIAIARAVIRQPDLLILDEATSALDEESQRKVQIALENIMDGRTSIVIAHRLTTIEKCNRVVVLEHG
jgi:ATP-binding cassette subfamily B (MDR/TAP) protein 1